MAPNEAARNFWARQDDFPKSFRIDANNTVGGISLETIDHIRSMTHAFCPPPSEGNIADIGGGSSTHLYLPEAVNRIYVIDFSQTLLEKSRVPSGQRLLMDIGEDTLPGEFVNFFSYAFMCLVSRYLTGEQKIKAYLNIHLALSPGANLWIVDTKSVPNEYARIMGQAETFDLYREIHLLEEVGFHNTYALPTMDRIDGSTIDFIYAQKPE